MEGQTGVQIGSAAVLSCSPRKSASYRKSHQQTKLVPAEFNFELILLHFFNCKSSGTFKTILKTNSRIIPRPRHPQLFSRLHISSLPMCGLHFPLVMGNMLHEKQTRSAPKHSELLPWIYLFYCVYKQI